MAAEPDSALTDQVEAFAKACDKEKRGIGRDLYFAGLLLGLAWPGIHFVVTGNLSIAVLIGGAVLGVALGLGLKTAMRGWTRKRYRRMAQRFLDKFPENSPLYQPALEILVACKTPNEVRLDLLAHLPGAQDLYDASAGGVVSFGDSAQPATAQTMPQMPAKTPAQSMEAVAKQVLDEDDPLWQLLHEVEDGADAEAVGDQLLKAIEDNPNAKVVVKEEITEDGDSVKMVYVSTSSSSGDGSAPPDPEAMEAAMKAAKAAILKPNVPFGKRASPPGDEPPAAKAKAPKSPAPPRPEASAKPSGPTVFIPLDPYADDASGTDER